MLPAFPWHQWSFLPPSVSKMLPFPCPCSVYWLLLLCASETIFYRSLTRTKTRTDCKKETVPWWDVLTTLSLPPKPELGTLVFSKRELNSLHILADLPVTLLPISQPNLRRYHNAHSMLITTNSRWSQIKRALTQVYCFKRTWWRAVKSYATLVLVSF